MVFTPNSKIFLLNTVLCEDQNNQLDFTSVTAQTSYFLSKVVGSFSYEDCTYVRKDNVLRVPASLDQLWNVNYLMYQNTMFTNKWFYCFIIGRKYINDNCTELTLKTDVFQSWMFNYDILPSFVEREHVEDDSVGKHILDESLQLGEFVCNKKSQWLNQLETGTYTPNDLQVVVGVTEIWDGESFTPTAADDHFTPGEFCWNNGIPGFISYIGFRNNTEGLQALQTFVNTYAYGGKSDAIVTMFLYPRKFLTNLNNRQLIVGSNHTIANYINYNDGETLDLSISNIDSYTPKNNKLKTFPFCYLDVSNGNGSDSIYRFEDFYTIVDDEKIIHNPEFRVDSCITPSGSIRMIPHNYKGVVENDNEGINLGKFPITNWTSDVYTNWLTQNALNIGATGIKAGIDVVLGAKSLVTTEGALGGNQLSSGLNSVFNLVNENYKESLIPPQASGNINCGDVVTASGNNDFHFHVMTIKSEVAKVVDDFFSMFGYKVNEVKSPNLSSRQNWNYIKTSNVIIEGQAPDEDIDELKKIFNKGITIWHNPATFGDYSQTNNIV